MACQVSNAFNICLKGLDTIMRSQLFKFELVFLGNRAVINAKGVVWGLQHLCHYRGHALGPVFSVSSATIILVYDLRVLRAAASTSESCGYYYDSL